MRGFRPDAKRLSRLAEFALSGNTQVQSYHWSLFARGLYEYRAGNHADALARGRESRRRVSSAMDFPEALTELNLAIEAMALNAKGDVDEDHRTLAQAKAELDIHVPGLGDGVWHGWLAAHILYREAEAVAAGKRVGLLM